MSNAFARFLVRRVAAAVALVFVVSSSALLLARIAPADSSLESNPDVIAATRHALDLDRPFYVQYASWLTRGLRLDLGESLRFRRPVLDLLKDRSANTAVLGLSALALATLVGLPLGVLTGSRRGALSRLTAGLSLLVLSVPPIVTSIVLVLVAARTGWLPAGGMASAASGADSFTALLDMLRHLALPAVALALPIAASLERLQSRAIEEALAEPCIAAARARGIPPGVVIWRHGLRLSLKPVLAIYGVTIGSVLSGSFVVEIVMSWPGLGDLMWEALKARDVYLVAGCAAAGAVFLALGILVSDIALTLVDPRVEHA